MRVCGCEGGGGWREGCGVHGGGNQLSPTKNRGVMKVGVLFIRISKGLVGDQIIFIVTQSKSF